MNNGKVYIDLDGVCADLEKWLVDIYGSHDVFLERKQVYQVMRDNYKDCFAVSEPTSMFYSIFYPMYKSSQGNVFFLTSGGKFIWDNDEQYQTIRENKRIWCRNNGIDLDHVIITDGPTHKTAYCKSKNDILFDDRLKTIEAWRKVGGIGIHIHNEFRLEDRYNDK